MIRRWLLLVLMVVGMVVPFVPTDSAEAFAGRTMWRGYFTNFQDTSGDDVIGGGLYPVAAPTQAEDFINKISNYLTGPGGRDQTGAAFIILTMMGRAPGTVSIASAFGEFGAWRDRVRYYASQPGWIDWNSNRAFTENTYWQGNNGGGSNPNDVAWYSDAGSDPAITFFSPVSGRSYVIRKVCGNPIGDLGELDSPDYNMDLSATALTSEGPGPVYPVVAGRAYNIGVTVNNSGPAGTEPGTLQAMLPAGVCAPSPACPLNMIPFFGWSSANGYRATSAGPPFPAGGNWYWNVNALPPPPSVTSAAYWFTPTGAVGTTFTFNLYYYKKNRAGAVATASLNYRIVSERTPGISAANSDIHAGGGICDQAQTPGNVTTRPGGASVGQYVISASGSINNIVSNNAAPPDQLKAGGYSPVCRQDLLGAVNAEYPLAGSNCFPANCAAGGTQTVTLTGNEQGVYYFNGTRLILQGTVGNAATTKPLTIIARFGTVEISDRIQLTNATRLPHEVPSLGIIAAQDILINPAATRVDAYLFSSQGTIVTCNAPVANCATPPLHINGFLMGRNILFGRTGPVNTNGTAASEVITLNPQIYLNPPKYFDAGIDDILLEGQGERAPLF